MWHMWWNLVAGSVIASGIVLLRLVAGGIYGIFIHPLRAFPGPISWRLSRIPYARSISRGTLPYDIARLHQKYGPVVRVAPNELAVAHPSAWKDVMGGGARDLPKWKPAFQVNDIVKPAINTTVDRTHHRMLRKAMAPGFSDQALRAQQPLILKSIDLLVDRLRGVAFSGVEANMVDWFMFTAFDIIGDLALGEPFGNLERSDFHPWVRSITRMGRGQAVFGALNMFPWVKSMLGLLFHKAMEGRYRLHLDILAEMLRPRVDKSEQRADLMGPILVLREEWNMSMDDLVTHAGVFVAAGSMTATIVLSSTTYFLLTHPKEMSKATREVREAFSSDDEITIDSVGKLKYTIACLDEAMRLVPPVGTGLPRITEKEGATICGQFVPPETVVTVQPYAMYHSPENFRNPEEFHPERFLGEKRFSTDCVECVKPFHTGTRDCLGRNLGVLEMRLILARLLFNFDMRLAESSKNWVDQLKVYRMVYEEPPLNVRLTSRKANA